MFELLFCPQHGILAFIVRYFGAVDPQVLLLTFKTYYLRGNNAITRIFATETGPKRS